MKVYRTKSGFCYKELKSGKKKRISKDEYLRLSKSKQSSPRKTTYKIYRSKNGYFYKELKSGKKKRISKENYLKMTKKTIMKGGGTHIIYSSDSGTIKLDASSRGDYLYKNWHSRTVYKWVKDIEALQGLGKKRNISKSIEKIRDFETPLRKDTASILKFDSEISRILIIEGKKLLKESLQRQEQTFMNQFLKKNPSHVESSSSDESSSDDDDSDDSSDTRSTQSSRRKLTSNRVTSACFDIIQNKTGKNRVLGKGSFGEVKLARVKKVPRGVRLKINQEVAIKSINTKRANRDRNANRNGKTNLDKEIEILAILDQHPNIVKFYCMYEEGPNTCLVLELFKFPELFDMVQTFTDNIPKFFNERINILKQTAEAIAYIHSEGIMHRDIKPENILYNRAAQHIKFIDFGFAVQKKTSDRYCGTAEYMSPEIYRKETYTNKVDVWAFGILTSEIFTGSCIFNLISRNINEIKRAVLNDRYDYMKEVKSMLRKYPKELQTVIAEVISKCLVKNPRDRASMEEILKLPLFVNKYNDVVVKSNTRKKGSQLQPREVGVSFTVGSSM